MIGPPDAANPWAAPPRWAATPYPAPLPQPTAGPGAGPAEPATPGYAAWYSAPELADAAYEAPLRPRSLRGLGTTTAWLLGSQVLLGVAGAGVSGWSVLTWSRRSGTLGASLPADSAEVVLLLLRGSLTTLTALAFISWLYVAASNAERSGAHLRHGAGWAIGAWFVPLFNLWRPRRILEEVWRASSPGVPPGVDLSCVRSSGVVTFWWLSYLLSSALPGLGVSSAIAPAVRAAVDARRAGAVVPAPEVVGARFQETLALWSLWGSVFAVIAAGLALHLVLRITAWQQHRIDTGS